MALALNFIKKQIKKSHLARLAMAHLRSSRRKSQSNENEILLDLTEKVDAPKTFVEFGFNVHEYNCMSLEKAFNGLLIDGNGDGVRVARHFLPANVGAEQQFLTLDNLDFITDRYRPRELGVLSIDIDGNDYWILERLLILQPAIISVEYNASMGLRPLTVPYDAMFIRQEKHPTGWYHGASCTALTALCQKNGYDLVAFDEGGCNVFFVRSDLRPASISKIEPEKGYRDNKFRNLWSGTTSQDQWEKIKNMPFVEAAP